MKFHFYNAKILSNGNIINGDVLVDGNQIKFVGANPPSFNADRKIDVNGNLLMSGFANAHCHTPMTLLRGIKDDVNLDEWLFENIIPIENNMTKEDVYWGEMLGIAEYVAGGITCIEEGYFFNDAVTKALDKSGLRARVGIGTTNLTNVPAIKKLKDDYSCYKWNDLIKPVCFAHAIYTVSEESFDVINSFAKKHNLPVSFHLSETLKEVGDCSVKFDKTPPEYLEDLGLFDRKATAYHCVQVDKDDIDVLSIYDVNVVTCPSSNLKLGSGIAPVYQMQNKGINVAIGTDGAGSNNSLDMFKEMFLVATLNKALLNDATILPAKKVVEMATKNGYKALDFEKGGDIIEDNLADLILIDLNKVHQAPCNNIVSNLVYASKSSDVYLTMVNGKILYENGEFFIGEKICDIIDYAKKFKDKIKGE